ncbi:hypothetical protein Blut17040_07550 [Blautia luti]|nr:hypothetical protein Blut17040_07550 [Blautia luti]
MAVDPQQKTGCCVTDQKDDLHDEQDTASVVVQIVHIIMHGYISQDALIGSDGSQYA